MDYIGTGFLNYQVFKNGNVFVSAFNDLCSAQRKLRSIAKRGVYVEIWAYYADGSRHLIDYEN